MIQILALLVIGTGVCFYFYSRLFLFLLAPFYTKSLPISFILLSPFEGFVLTCYVSLICGTLMTSPLWVFLLLRFFLPGLREKEKKILFLFIPLSIFFIFLGVWGGYKITLPYVIEFFYAFNAKIGNNLWALKEGVSCILWIVASHAIAFEGIAILWGLIFLGLINVSLLKKIRPWMIISFFILGAFLTPPDVLSQLCVAIPLCVLYEISIFLAMFLQKKNK